MLDKLKSFIRNLKLELKVWKQVLKDERTPWLAKILLGLAIAYLVLPFDIIPDTLPVIGQMDDIIIVGFLTLLALSMIPKKIVDDCRMKVRFEER